MSNKPPSGLKPSRLKKFVKLSSPYNLTDCQPPPDAEGDIRIAGKAGIGDGDLPYLACDAGDAAAFDPLNEDLLDEGLSNEDGGGNMDDGVLGTDAVGVIRGFACEDELSSLVSSLALVRMDSASLAVDSRRAGRGRLCELAVRVWR